MRLCEYHTCWWDLPLIRKLYDKHELILAPQLTAHLPQIQILIFLKWPAPWTDETSRSEEFHLRVAMDIDTLCCVWKTAISSNNWYPQECIPVGCVPSAAVTVCGGGGSAQGGVCWGCLARGCLPGGICPGGCLPGGSAQGGICPLGVCRGGVCLGGVSQHALRQTHPSCGQNSWHMLENITFPQLRLRTVKMAGTLKWRLTQKYDSKFFVVSFYL